MKFKFHYHLAGITSALHEDQYTRLIISRSVPLRITNISEKFVGKIKTHILCLITLFSKFIPFIR